MAKNKKATKKEIETVISNLIREVEFVGRKSYEIHATFALYLDYKNETEKFDKFLKERVEEARKSVEKDNESEPGDSK